jgi:hypothetical protein
MIRLGRYDAYDKWEILCRHWADPASVTDPIVDKWNAPALPHWQDLALAGGTYACGDYIDAKLLWLQSSGGAEPTVAQSDDSTIHPELARLAAQLGRNELRSRVRKLGSAIAKGGFRAPFDEGLSPALVERLREVFRTGALGLLRWCDMRGEVPTIDVMRTRKNAFPVGAIKHKQNVLSLFSALNFGRSDVIHIHDACSQRVTLVDIHADCLADMQLIYPAHWTFACMDYKQFLANQGPKSYDLIVADPPLSLVNEVVWDQLPTIVDRCSDTFITNFTAEICDQLGAARNDLEGLSRALKAKIGVDVAFVEMMERNSSVYWAVMRVGG